jgi:hypothetical protein
MRDYGKVHTSFWTSSNIRELSEDGRTMAIYLLTCPHGTIAGVFRLPDGYACEDLQWSAERVQVTLSELLSNGFSTRCEATKWVWVTKHLEWNPPENPNQIKAAAKMALQVPDSCSWRASFIGKHGVYLGLVTPKTEPLPNPSKTLSQPVTVTVTVTGDNSTADKSAPTPPGFAKFWETWPTNDRKQAKGKCLDAWKKAHAERDAALVIDHVLSLKNGSWTKDAGQFVPAPLTYLNGRRWEGAEATGSSAGGGIFAGAI